MNFYVKLQNGNNKMKWNEYIGKGYENYMIKLLKVQTDQCVFIYDDSEFNVTEGLNIDVAGYEFNDNLKILYSPLTILNDLCKIINFKIYAHINRRNESDYLLMQVLLIKPQLDMFQENNAYIQHPILQNNII